MKLHRLAPIAFVLVAALPAAADVDNFVEAAFARLRLGEPMQSDLLILIPLIDDEASDKPPAVRPDVVASKLAFAEPAWPERRYDVEVRNGEDEPVLLLGGTILVGGKLDRMVPRDVLLPAGSTLEIRMLPADYQRRYRGKPAPFKRHSTVAPVYLRERAITNPHRNLVPTFVSHFLEFRPEGDDRLSLAAIGESPALAGFCAACHTALAKFPDIADKRVVGFVTAIRGRVYSAEVFGDNTLLRTYFTPLLHAHAYAAAAIKLRAKRVGFPLPDSGAEAMAKARGMVEKLLERLKTKARYRAGKLPSGTLGESVLFKTGGTNGHALGYKDRIVHAVVFPYDPFESRLYSKPLVPPDDDGQEDPDTLRELERREGGGRRLTEYEKRLLDRMRQRRGGRLPRDR